MKTETKNADLRLLKSRLLLATMDFIEGDPCKEMQVHMKKLLLSYAYAKTEVKEAFAYVFDFLQNDRVTGEPATKEQVKNAKKMINEIAKLVWKRKKSAKK